MRAVIPVRSRRRELPVVFSFLLAACLGAWVSPASAAASDRPPPPPGPYTSTTLVDNPVEEAEALGFPPLDYAPSLGESGVPRSKSLRWEEEFPDESPAAAAPEDQATFPPLESDRSPVAAPEAPAKSGSEALVAPATSGGSDLGHTGVRQLTQPPPASLEQSPRAREPETAPTVTRQPGGGYPPLEGGYQAEGVEASPDLRPSAAAGADHVVPREPDSGTVYGEGHRAAEAPGRPESSRANAPRQAAPPAPPAGQSGPVYGYQGYQVPRPYYPVQPRGWASPPGYRAPQPQQGQGATGRVQPGAAGAPSYPGMYYPPPAYRPGGYGQFAPPPPSQGSASGGPQ